MESSFVGTGEVVRGGYYIFKQFATSALHIFIAHGTTVLKKSYFHVNIHCVVRKEKDRRKYEGKYMQ